MSPAAQLKSPLVIDRQVGARGLVEFGFQQLQIAGSHPFTEMVSAEFPIRAEELLDTAWTLTRANARGGHFIDVSAVWWLRLSIDHDGHEPRQRLNGGGPGFISSAGRVAAGWLGGPRSG